MYQSNGGQDGKRVAYSLAKTPLKAAHAPLEMASISHNDVGFGVDMLGEDIGQVRWSDVKLSGISTGIRSERT